ncbi:uncharacterized protein EDB91DRAFT_1080180 [Suillus paluster]|uniref:uncharacterized protein n=1 Tax=Suillus paluster TaxID=48578 RepID=UPI001B862D4C|nr:uncharacterized protein EDB91DRAFT_1080180 [Suillus paluster]KAG1745938.1 hypothetical protein EDB91DRAFT_1080180 [Suillus paluster]
MDMHFDESWCPVCDRQIMPKRYTVPVLPQPQETTTPAPTSSPTSSSPSKNQQSDSTARTSRTKTGAIRAKSGLLQGTGRVKPNGAIKRSDSMAANKGRASSPQSQQIAKPPAPVKHRTVIDQGPIPLYCSDECRVKDLARRDGAYPLNYHPDRSSPLLPPVPHNSFERRYCDSEDESSTSASASSLDSGFSCPSPSVTVSRSMATLAALYNFPPLPPAPPILSSVDSTSSSQPEYHNDYQGGTMMAGKRIKEVLCPARPKPTSFYGEPSQPRKPVPGWTDGGIGWRQSVYGGYSKRSDNASVGSDKAQTSFAASSHRGVQWTATLPHSNSSSALATQCPTPNLPPRSSQSYSDELYTKYSLPLSRRSESRMILFPPASCSTQTPPLSPTSTSSSSRRRREVPLLKRGAEGRLLVPDVVLTRNNSSMGSLSQRLSKPLSRHPSEASEDSILSDSASESLGPSSRPAPQTRAWSYDNMKTYPVMMPPAKKERRIEHRMVDGVIKEVEVEVEIVQPLKRLFLFPGKETTPGRS